MQSHITTPALHHSIFTDQMLFLTPNQQCQSTEVIDNNCHKTYIVPVFSSRPQSEVHSWLVSLCPGGISKLKGFIDK